MAIVASGTIISRPNPRQARRGSSARGRPTAGCPRSVDSLWEAPRAARLCPAQIVSGAVVALALTGLKAAVRLVDDVGSAATANDPAIPVARL